MPSVIGHEAIVRDLTALAGKGGLSHGYIFHGPAMVGKRTTALALARFLEKGEFTAPAESEVLQDARAIGPVAGTDSVGIDAVREIKNFLWQKPNVSKKRALIIDDAELLTTEAQNALLKVTEEPPVSSLLILVTSDIESMMGTIQSRLQKVYFGVVPEAAIAKWFATGAGGTAITAAKAAAFAKKALGKPGLAWKLAHDEAFQKELVRAEGFIKTTPAGRKDFIKKLLEPDDFSLRNFLGAVIINLAWEKPSKTRAALWHRTLALQQDVSNFGLNPRLQLEALLMNS
jgi:hypothetical protein